MSPRKKPRVNAISTAVKRPLATVRVGASLTRLCAPQSMLPLMLASLVVDEVVRVTT